MALTTAQATYYKNILAKPLLLFFDKGWFLRHYATCLWAVDKTFEFKFVTTTLVLIIHGTN